MTKCVLCKKEIKGYGNNPEPLAGNKTSCCDECNITKVIPARIQRYKEGENMKSYIRSGEKIYIVRFHDGKKWQEHTCRTWNIAVAYAEKLPMCGYIKEGIA